MSNMTYVAAMEYDAEGRTRKVHAVAVDSDGRYGSTTACGLAAQPYSSTGTDWNAVRTVVRCRGCAEALGTPDPLNVR